MACDRMFVEAGKAALVWVFSWRRIIILIVVTLAGAVTIVTTDTAVAAKINPKIAGLCDRAAAVIASENDVPLDVLRAISRAETGRSTASGLQPWPWTVNMQGTGRWFATLDEARSYVFSHFKDGARSFDVGCFQINYKWHGDAFRSIDDMFDPLLNARYAAGFLTELYREFGNWPDAAGAYHSRTPKFANKYSARFSRIKNAMSDSSDMVLATQRNSGRLFNTKPRKLRQTEGPSPLAAGQVSLGSLMPMVRQNQAPVRPFVVIN